MLTREFFKSALIPAPPNKRRILNYTKLILIISATIIASTIPFHRSFGTDPYATIFNSIAADSYYYLRIASVYLDNGIISFDGSTPTNGFMPLWQIYLILIGHITNINTQDPIKFIELAFFSSLAFFTIGNAINVIALHRLARSVPIPLLILLICPGSFFWLFSIPYRIDFDPGLMYGFSSWSFVNGMESSIGYFIFSFLLLLMSREKLWTQSYFTFFISGLLSFLIFMSRLDDIFLIFSILIVFTYRFYAQDHNDVAKKWLCFLAIPILGTIIYVIVNLTLVGNALPTSGESKTSFLSFPTLASLSDFKLFELFSGHDIMKYSTRLIPNFVFLFFGIMILAIFAKKIPKDYRCSLICAISLYMVLKYSFLISSVEVMHQGYWYYTIGNISMGLVIAICLGLFLERKDIVLNSKSLSLILIAVFLNTAWAVQHRVARLDDKLYSSVFSHVCQNASEIRNLIIDASKDANASAKIIDTEDGIYAFCLNLPSLSFTGLASSPEILDRRNEVGFFKLATKTGHVFLVDSIVGNSRYGSSEALKEEGFEAAQLFKHGPIVVSKIF